MNSVEHPNAELIELGQPLVYAIAKKIYRSIPVRAEMDDLIAYGEIGLHEAARDFDASRGAKFTTFAYYRIRGAIYDGLSKMCWTSRSRYRRLRFQQLANEVVAEDDNATPPDNLNDGVNWFSQISQRLGVVYLSSQCHDSEGESAEARLEAPGPTATTIVANREINQLLRELIEELPAAQGRLIRMIYFDGATIKQAADRLGMSKSWASRLHAKVLDDLGRKLRRTNAA